MTDQCNARCQHCAYHCGPDAKDVMTLDDARMYIRELSNQFLEFVCISGGEPCLYFDLVTDIVGEARGREVPNIWVFTNAYWAVNQQVADLKTGQLKKAGMTRICLSADGFHEPFIPVERVHHAMEAARRLGLEIVLDSRFLGSPEQENPTNQLTRQVLMELGDLRNIETWQGQPLCVGRAADILASQLPQISGMPKRKCRGPWAGGTWENPAGVDVDSYGEVTLCPGMSVGNAKKRSLTRILADYDPNAHPIIRELADKGPSSLAKMAHRRGYKPRGTYVSECHLCYDVRRFLRAEFPSELKPPICYEES